MTVRIRAPRAGAPPARAAAVGLLGLLGLGALGCGAPEPRNLVLVSLDTVRRDHLSVYGYERETTPALDNLAARGAVFETAVAQQTNTNPSHGSILTGLYPHQHGSLFNRVPVAPEQVTLAEIVQRAGFRTGGFVSGLPLQRPLTGLEQGFEVFGDRFDGLRREGRRTVDRALEWLETIGRNERYFLFVHLYDAHGPYRLPEEGDGPTRPFRSDDPGPRLARVPAYQRLEGPAGRPIVHLDRFVDRYDTLIRYQDRQVDRILRRVDRGETLIVVLSDHGEVLGGRHWPLDHGATAFDEELRIPLLLAGPGIEPSRLGDTVETVDLLPTVLELLRVAPTGAEEATRDADPGASLPPLPGRSLVPLLRRGRDPDRPRPAFSCSRAESRRVADRGYRLDEQDLIRSIRTRSWKLVLYPAAAGEPYFELYDLRRDPGESSDVAERYPDRVQRLRARLAAWWNAAESPPPAPDDLPEATRRRLQSLGYLGGPDG